MTKPLRSPVVGYNHNLRYRGRLFHVQSEDSGPVNPHVFTHLFFEGTILSSKKIQYPAEAHEDTVKLFEEASREAKDPEVKAWATKTLPGLKHHLEMAKALNVASTK